MPDDFENTEDESPMDAVDILQDDEKPIAAENRGKKKGAAGRRQDGKSSKDIVLNDRYIIYANEHMHDFEHQYADAYMASGSAQNKGEYVAMVMKGRYPCRISALFSVSSLEAKNTMLLKEWGYVWWPEEKRVRFVMIFGSPPGKKVMSNLSSKFDVLSEDSLRFGVIRPLFTVLRELSDRGIMHGRVNPTNIFLTGADSITAVLGEGFSHAPGMLQPLLFETLERGMCDLQHKGEGSIKDDIYALGMTIAIMARGENPLKGKKDDDIINLKIERGSYAMMTDALRMTPAISELLRGCLADQTEQRWGVEEMHAWIDGSRATGKQKSATKKAQRAIDFNNKKFWRPRALARELPNAPGLAMELIEGGSLSQWLSRAMSSQELAENVTEAITRAQMNGKGEGYADRLVTYVCMVLDPTAPIRFRGQNILPAGLGWGMAYSYAEGESVQLYGEMIRDRYCWTWLGFKENMAVNTHEFLRMFDSASKMISRRGLDFGIERCLYHLCPDSPCMSERLQDYYVVDCEDLLKALDDLGLHNESVFKSNITEKHTMAFIAARDKKDVSGISRLIETTDKMKHSLAIITLFRDLQIRHYRGVLQGLSGWLAKYCDPIVKRFHRRSTRKDIQEKLEKTIKTGDLNKLISLIDNPANVKKDEYEFQRAKKEFVELEYQKETLKQKVNSEEMYGKETGKQFAAVVSGVTAAVLIAAVMMMKVTM